MNICIKKIVCKCSAVAIAIASVSVMALPAFAQLYTPTTNPKYVSNFNDYAENIPGSVSRLNAAPYSCTVSSTSSDYNGRYKQAEYYLYKAVGTGYSYYTGDVDSGTTKSVACYPEFNQNSVARKIYAGQVRQGTDHNATIKDEYRADIRLL